MVNMGKLLPWDTAASCYFLCDVLTIASLPLRSAPPARGPRYIPSPQPAAHALPQRRLPHVIAVHVQQRVVGLDAFPEGEPVLSGFAVAGFQGDGDVGVAEGAEFGAVQALALHQRH